MDSDWPFPTDKAALDARETQAVYRAVHTVCADERYHFVVELPERWKLLRGTDQPPTKGACALLAYFGEPDRRSVGTTVSVALLERDLAPADWLGVLLDLAQEQTLARRDVPTEGGTVADVLTCSTRASTSEAGKRVSRWLAFKDENRMWLVHSFCSSQQYEHEADRMLVAVTSTILLNSGDFPCAERLQRFSLAHPGDFCTYFPVSWSLELDPNSHDKLFDARVVNRLDQQWRGQLWLSVVKRDLRDDVEPLVRDWERHLRERGTELTEMALETAEPLGGFSSMRQGKSEGSLKQAPVELRATLGERPDAWFLLTLLGPARELSAWDWAINKRCYEIALETFRTPNE